MYKHDTLNREKKGTKEIQKMKISIWYRKKTTAKYKYTIKITNSKLS